MKIPGVNIQTPWAELIASGKKVVETRFYPLPDKYVMQEMALIETPGQKRTFRRRVIAVVVFGPSFPYESEEAFYSDTSRHLVSRDSTDFTWNSGKGKRKWGWPIVSVRAFRMSLPDHFRGGILFSRAVPLRAGVGSNLHVDAQR